MMPRRSLQWILLAAVALTLVLAPFALFGGVLAAWTERFLHTSAQHPLWTAVVLGTLLISDILLPVPSMLVSTAAGFLLGFAGGMLTSLVGMTVGSALGYWLGAQPGRALARRVVGSDELRRFGQLYGRYGDWTILVARAVPVLAEVSTFFAGMSRMPWARYLLLSALANLGISAVYAAVGAFSATVDSFLMACAGALVIPGIVLLCIKDRGERV